MLSEINQKNWSEHVISQNESSPLRNVGGGGGVEYFRRYPKGGGVRGEGVRGRGRGVMTHHKT